MQVIQLPPEILRTGQPTPVSVRDSTGHLLIAKGVVLATEEQRQRLVSRELFVDERDGELIRRAMAGKLDNLLRKNTMLGRMAEAQPDGSSIGPNGVARKAEESLLVTSGNLQMRLSMLLRDPPPQDFAARLDQLQQDLLALIDDDADMLMLLLVQAITSDARHYSVTHALLVAVLGELASRQLPTFTPAWRQSLRCAALTMNISMTALQDQLARQDTPPSAEQRARIDAHAERAAICLRESGISDEFWLHAVAHHHTTGAGPLAVQAPGQQLARLLHRADIFSARLSMRKLRPAMNASEAVKAAYLDENHQADEAGTALIQATGIYPPGSYVRLTSGELAVVLRRGAHAKAPRVASLVGRSGTPLVEPTVRDTRLRPHDVASGIAPSEVKVRLNMEKLLKLA